MGHHTYFGLVVYIVLLVSLRCHGKVLTTGTTSSIPKEDSTACKATVYCQIALSNSASTFEVNGISVCSPGSSTTTINIGTGTTIPIKNNVQSGDYFRAILTEIKNSCSQTGVTTGAGSCGVTPTGAVGIISSPSYPKQYTSNLNCSYNFPAKAGYCGVQLKFSAFQVEGSAGCLADYLGIKDERFCANQLADKTIERKTPITVTFKTNALVNSLGFLASYQYLKSCDSICEETLKKRNGYITPPLDDKGNYKNNQHCSYMITPNEGAKCVILSFKAMTLDKADYVEVDGQKYTEKPPAKDVKALFPQGGKPLPVKFVSDATKNPNDGFLIKYSQIFDVKLCPTKRCGPVMTLQSGDLKSPGYPSEYPKNDICVYVIKPFNNSVSAVLFLKSKLADGDTLKLMEGKEEKDPLEPFMPKNIKFPTADPKEIKLKFTSDGALETKFTISVIQIPGAKTGGGKPGGGGAKPGGGSAKPGGGGSVK